MLSRYLQQAAAAAPDDAAIIFEDREHTYGDLEARSNRVARELLDRGIRPGDRVAVILMNRPEWIVAVQAVLKVGGSVVTPLASYRQAEFEHVLELTRPTAVIAEARSIESLPADAAGYRFLASVDPDPTTGWEDWSKTFAEKSSTTVTVEVDPSGEAMLLMSSGTTGMPKAVRHSHRSIAAIAEGWARDLGLTSGDRMQYIMPASTIFGASTFFAAFDRRARISLFARFDVESMLRNIQEHRITIGMAAAPVAVAMQNFPALHEFDLSSLRFLVWGATPITRDVADKVTARSGVRWMHAYGITEMGGIAANPIAAPETWRLDSPGPAIEGVEVRFIDEQGSDVAPGEPGELVIRSQQLMLGYLPEESNEGVWFDDGWFRTGDIGFLDSDRFIRLVDRSKDLIKVSGLQVSPVEVESQLFSHPDVLDCGVYGIPDPEKGERPAAVVVLRPGSPVSPQDLVDWAASRSATYKRLARIDFVDAVPRNPSGKVLRRDLPELALAAHEKKE